MAFVEQFSMFNHGVVMSEDGLKMYMLGQATADDAARGFQAGDTIRVVATRQENTENWTVEKDKCEGDVPLSEGFGGLLISGNRFDALVKDGDWNRWFTCEDECKTWRELPRNSEP